MILKLGRVVDGRIIESEFIRSQVIAMALMITPREYKQLVAGFEATGPSGVMCGAPGSCASDPNHLAHWLQAGWSDYLASIPPGDNPLFQAEPKNGTGLILPAGVKP